MRITCAQKKFLKILKRLSWLYGQSNTLLLGDIFEIFGNICLEIYELDPAHFLSVPGLLA